MEMWGLSWELKGRIREIVLTPLRLRGIYVGVEEWMVN